MPELKLIYFDMDGGRGEPMRIALTAAGIPFQDERWSFEEFSANRGALPLNQVPVMEIDGEVVTQSNALNRYVGKLTGLYPGDDLAALHCDEAMAIVEDAFHAVQPTFFLEGDAQREAREKLVAGPLPRFLKRLNAMLETRGGRFFAGGALSMADIKVYLWVRALLGGLLDHVPTDLVQRVAPALVAHYERIADEPAVADYYATRG